MADVEGYKGLDEKIRLVVSLRMNDESAKKCQGLVTELRRKADEHEFRNLPEPNGRQMLHTIRSFYEIEPEEKDMFDIKILWDLKYWGDAQLHPWKAHWDYLLRMQRDPPTDRNLRSFFPDKLKTSTRLVKYLDQYERACEGEPEKTFAYLDKMIEKVIKEDRCKANVASHAGYHDGLSQGPKKHAAPATTDDSAGNPKTDPKKDDGKKGKGGKGGQKGKGDGKGGKGGKDGKKGGGKGGDGGKSGDTPKANEPAKKADPNKSCITNFFGKCKLGAHLGPGVKCDYGCHRKVPTDTDRAHFLFKKMEAQHGAWAPGKFPYPDGGNKPNAAAAANKGGPSTQTPAGSPGGGQNA